MKTSVLIYFKRVVTLFEGQKEEAGREVDGLQ